MYCCCSKSMDSILPKRLKIQKPSKKIKHKVKRCGLFRPSFTIKVSESYTKKKNHSGHDSVAGLATGG